MGAPRGSWESLRSRKVPSPRISRVSSSLYTSTVELKMRLPPARLTPMARM